MNGYDCAQQNLIWKTSSRLGLPMSCSLLNPALAFMLLESGNYIYRDQTCILRAWHSSWHTCKKSINVCKYKPALKMKERRLLETTWLVLTDRTPNKRSQRQKNAICWIHFYKVQKQATLNSYLQQWWDNRLNLPSRLKQLRSSSWSVRFNDAWPWAAGSMVRGLWPKGKEWALGSQFPALIRFPDRSTRRRSPNAVRQPLWETETGTGIWERH